MTLTAFQASTPQFAQKNTSESTNDAIAAQFCEHQLQDLAELLPDTYIKLMYRTGTLNQRQMRCAHSISDRPVIDQSFWRYLESENWWADHIESLAPLRITHLDLCETHRLYICPIRQLDTTEYLFVLSASPLTCALQRIIMTYSRQIHDYLLLFQQCYSFQSSLEFLKQSIRKTEHQLRSPLALLEIYSGILVAKLAEHSLQPQALQMQTVVSELNQHLTQLTTEPTNLHTQRFDLKDVLAESIQSLQPWLNEKRLRIKTPMTSVVISGDRWQLRQVFDNLLNNAIHFSPIGGEIGCDWQVFRHEVLVHLWDSGPGLSSEDLKSALTPYYSRRPGGTGLGLAIAQTIISAHHGRLWASNASTGGAKFSFSLPRSF